MEQSIGFFIVNICVCQYAVCIITARKLFYLGIKKLKTIRSNDSLESKAYFQTYCIGFIGGTAVVFNTQFVFLGVVT